MSDASYSKPTPSITEESKPYWDGLRENRLVLQRCADCNKIRHYPRPMCDRCYSMRVEWIEASGTGKIHSWTTAHQAFHPGFKQDIPYTLATVDLPEGVRIQARIRSISPEQLRCGMPVRIGFEQVSDDLSLLVVLPSDQFLNR